MVDVETTGLRREDIAVEIAWRDLTTNERGSFVPRHDPEWVLMHGQPEALDLNGYWRRGLAEAPHDDGSKLLRLHHALRGQRLAGANPTFDAAHLQSQFTAAGMHPGPWHHRLLDLSAYAAGVLGLDPSDLPGCAGVCDLLGIPAGDHTAAADVEATGLAFKALMAKAGVTDLYRRSRSLMAGETIVHLSGNLTSSPELRFTPSGAAVINFTVASTPRTFDRQSNEWKDGSTLFMRCALWRQAAENMAESNLEAGARVMVSGRLVQRSFEHQGQKRTVVELEVDEVGPSLKYATAKVNKVSRSDSGSPAHGRSGTAPAEDPWGASAPADEESPPF